MFLWVTASVTNWDADGTSSNLILEDSPLVDFVEPPFQIHFRSILLQHNKRSYQRSCGDGHVITHKGLAADCSKVESMKTWPGPQTIQALSGFLGLTGYDRKFAKDWENKAGLN